MQLRELFRQQLLQAMLFVSLHQLIEAEWHIYLSMNFVNIDSDNDLSSGRHQALI